MFYKFYFKYKIIIIYEFICNDLIGVYVNKERLYNPRGVVSDNIYKTNVPSNGKKYMN